MHFTYILKCSDGSYYTGITWNVRKRKKEHDNGLCDYTRIRLPVKLVFFAGFPSQKAAAQFEKYLKSHAGCAFRNKHLVNKKTSLPGVVRSPERANEDRPL